MGSIDRYIKRQTGEAPHSPKTEAKAAKYGIASQQVIEALDKHKTISDADYLEVVKAKKERRAKVLNTLGLTRKNLKRAAVLGAMASGALLGTTFFAGAAIAPSAPGLLKAKAGLDLFLGITKNVGNFLYKPARPIVEPASAVVGDQLKSGLGTAKEQLESLSGKIDSRFDKIRGSYGKDQLFSTGTIGHGTISKDEALARLDAMKLDEDVASKAKGNIDFFFSNIANENYETYINQAPNFRDMLNSLNIDPKFGFSGMKMPDNLTDPGAIGQWKALQALSTEKGPVVKNLEEAFRKLGISQAKAPELVNSVMNVSAPLIPGEGVLYPKGQYQDAGKYTKYTVPAVGGLAAMRILQPIKTLVPSTAAEPLYMHERWELGKKQRKSKDPAERAEIGLAREYLDQRRKSLVNQATAIAA